MQFFSHFYSVNKEQAEQKESNQSPRRSHTPHVDFPSDSDGYDEELQAEEQEELDSDDRDRMMFIQQTFENMEDEGEKIYTEIGVNTTT